jgi:hypothetical protein
MDAVNAIGQSTNTLVVASALVQADYNKLSKSEGKSTIRYKRDPAWAKGLISAAQQVAAAVSHLVHVGDQATKGEASEEALIVASKVEHFQLEILTFRLLLRRLLNLLLPLQ